MLILPAPPKREEELAEHVDMRQDDVRRLEADGDELKLAPIFKISALRMLTTGKAKEHFDLWELDRDTADPAKAYQQLLGKVQNYSRRSQMDNYFRKRKMCSTEEIPRT